MLLTCLRSAMLICLVLLLMGSVVLANTPETFVASSQAWAQAIALLSSGFNLGLMIWAGRQHHSSQQSTLLLAYIIAIGSLLRLWFALTTQGNFDQRSYEIVAEIVAQGGNVYAETSRYNYSPIWFMLLHSLNYLTPLPLYIEVRVFLTLVDITTVMVLWGIARQKQLAVLPVIACFYLNPLTILITGYHGQFENLALLALLVGIWAYFRYEHSHTAWQRIGGLWLGAALGVIIKHNIFYEAIIVMHYAVRRWWLKFGLLGLAAVLFLITFLPFLEEGQTGIIQNVFLYRSLISRYGFAIFNSPIATGLFVAALFVYPFLLRSSDLLTRCLQGTLFFLIFTTGISIQYVMLPIAFGALRRSPGFFIYSVVTTLVLLGHHENMALPAFQIFEIWFVWAAALVWWLGQLLAVRHEKATKIT